MSHEAPSVSLLVPICNVERYLRECLDSACKQTLRDIEIICINDGSTDNSLAIIQEYAAQDPRIVVIDKPNSGYGDSMNLGLARARGEYIGILESDDYMELDALERMYRAAQRGHAQVVKADFYFFWSTPTVCNKRAHFVDSVIEGHVNPQVEREVFYRKPSIWSAIYKRSFLEECNVSFLPTPGASYQDAGFNFKVWSSCTNAVLLDYAVLHYRQDNEKSSVNNPGKVFNVCDEYEEMWRYLDEAHADRPYLRAVLARMQFDSYEWNYDRLSDELAAQFLPKMREDMKRNIELGRVNLNIFEPAKRVGIKLLLERPRLYAIKRASDEDKVKTRMERFRSLLRIGGLINTFRLMAFRAIH
ncbi:glycosyltransferase [Collinsella sp. AGMB00827]|uniref:Glycosyltransferase n=1 Tax=Collinsella ureilytica TaxID=2869515 RepID=A0ABS7MIR8_9ACTN|nr:glycosyltransferase family 2 protein [Collinsella urealyticum]MBY4796986.1 glycosyltransferase [Collinsella urealyticum]